MAEYTDDTKTFTISLKSASTPATSADTSLQWIADNYDHDGNRRVDTNDAMDAGGDKNAGRITPEQHEAVMAAWRNNTLLPAPSGGTVTTQSTSVSLEWISQNYDVNGSRYIDTSEVQQASVDKDAGRITQVQSDAVSNAWSNHTLLPVYTGQVTTTTTTGTAKGELTDISYPPSATVGSRVDIMCRVHNIGDATGTFNVEIRMGTLIRRLSNCSVLAHSKSTTQIHKVSLPSTGSSVTCTLRCIRIT